MATMSRPSQLAVVQAVEVAAVMAWSLKARRGTTPSLVDVVLAVVAVVEVPAAAAPCSSPAPLPARIWPSLLVAVLDAVALAVAA
jgi:hypothetical protein